MQSAAEFVEVSTPAAPAAPVLALVAPVRKSPFTLIMDVWERWMRLSDSQVSHGDGNLQDTKDFMRCGEAVDVMIDDLPIVQRWAISKAHGISPAVWRFKDSAFEVSLEDAEVALIPKMKKHIATRRFFGL